MSSYSKVHVGMDRMCEKCSSSLEADSYFLFMCRRMQMYEGLLWQGLQKLDGAAVGQVPE